MVGVQWSIDTLDWKGLSAAEIVERVVPNAKSGDIILFPQQLRPRPRRAASRHHGTEEQGILLCRALGDGGDGEFQRRPYGDAAQKFMKIPARSGEREEIWDTNRCRTTERMSRGRCSPRQNSRTRCWGKGCLRRRAGRKEAVRQDGRDPRHGVGQAHRRAVSRSRREARGVGTAAQLQQAGGGQEQTHIARVREGAG